MSMIQLRVELPTHNHSFLVNVSSSSTIRDVKDSIYQTCVGHPHVDGQRIVCRGRFLANTEKLDDIWKSPNEPRIIHLAVHPSAWEAQPPTTAPHPSTQPETHSQREMPSLTEALASPPQPSPVHPINYILFMHQSAILSLTQSPVPQHDAIDIALGKEKARKFLAYHGYSWPAILNEPFPNPGGEPGLKYERVVIDGQAYLSLTDPSGEPNELQRHALNVLSYTLVLVKLPLQPKAPSRPPVVQSMPLPAHVNMVLQQLGLPQPYQPHNPNGPAVRAPILPNRLDARARRAPREVRLEIHPGRIMGPLLMIMFRTALLIYFFSPARTPVIALVIMACVFYELWRVLSAGIERVHAQMAAGGAPQPQREGDLNLPGNENNGAPNVVPNVPLLHPRPQPQQIGNPLGQAIETLATFNLDDEQRALIADGPNTEAPSLAHRIVTFVTLLGSTMHPAVWNRRREILQRREGNIRIDESIRSADDDDSALNEPRAERQRQLQARHERLPRWLREYKRRVVAAEWVDDLD